MHQTRFVTAGIATLAVGIAWAVDAADVKDFAGAWVIRSSSVAPWKDPNNPLGAAEPGHLIGKTVTFAANAVSGPAPIGCANPVYKVEPVGPDVIFEGQLAEPKEYAKHPDAVAMATKLAFADPHRIVTLDAGCTELQFHLVKPGTATFGLNNRVYLMTRK